MHLLLIDTASHDQSLSIVTEKETVHTEHLVDQKDDALLQPTLEKLVSESKMTLQDLTHIACVSGPGGFMSLRTGCAMANALSFALGIPSASIHLSDIWAARIKEKNVVWLHSTKKELLFIRGFGKFATQWPQAQLISLADAKETIPKGAMFVGELIPDQKEMLTNVQPAQNVLDVASVLPNLLVSLSYEADATLVPWYGREA